MLRAHHVVRPAVGLARDHGDLSDGGLGVRVDQLGPAPDDAVPLLARAGQEAGYVDERDHRDVEGVARAHEARGLLGRRDVERAGEVHRLVRDHADRPALDPAEADHDVLRVERLDLEKVLDHGLDHGVHVVGLVRRVRDQPVKSKIRFARREVRGDLEGGRFVQVVAREVRQQRAHVVHRVVLVGGQVVRVAAAGVVRPRTAQFLHPDVLAGHGADDVRTGDEHVRRLVDHHGEVGDRRGVDRTARARAHDQRDLRDDAAGADVAEEDVGVQAERDDALLDARTAGVVDADDRAADLHGQVEHLHDLLAEDLAERPAENCEVLREHAHLAAVDRAVPGHDAVAVRPVGV